MAPAPKSPCNVFMLLNTFKCISLSEILKSKSSSFKVVILTTKYLKNSNLNYMYKSEKKKKYNIIKMR